ncbi:N-acyl-D-amino-acid deacylase family protein [Natrialba sp. SSL1]|uniref:N-acyl-D-amino-acid deacylase family protein n=1 Tax=Natrialba sp. SSL1 TaxID=1869245 RepID=UPI0008F7E9C3|nr:D-aminoacylase [Natrialba sp. SSL1]OIB55281.1 N-acyl-D-amino acid deacylase [Natrialba sp. SSL1]
MCYDIILKNARIVDGTGAPWFRAAVVVCDGRISAIHRGKNIPDAEDVVDIKGNVVCPGFIDSHSHSDLQLFEDPTLEPKLRQGITTEILGQDGFSMAPIYREEAIDAWEDQISGLAGRMDKKWDWVSTEEYLNTIEETQIAPNIATLVGHGTVRFSVLGMEAREPTEKELDEMADLVTESLKDGAIGLSTGLVYTPQYHATTEEVRRLAGQLTPFERPLIAHIRSERFEIWNAFDEFMDIGADEDIPLHHSHFKVIGPPLKGKSDMATQLVTYARERGIDYTADVYPYRAGSTRLMAVLPPWVKSNTLERILEDLQTDSIRDKIRKDIEERRLDDWHNPGAYVGWDAIEIASTKSDSDSVVGKTIEHIANVRGTSPVEAICDLLVENDLEVTMILHQLDEADVRTVLRSDHTCIGTDGIFGSGKPHPRLYGTYPRILGKYVREESILSLEEAVHKMTGLPARFMGLYRKGILRPGFDADLVVFDPQVVGSDATYEHPQRSPNGISHVLVNGKFVVRDGVVTMNRPGTVIRAD